MPLVFAAGGATTTTTDSVSASENDAAHEKSLPTTEDNTLLTHPIPDATQFETGLARLPEDDSTTTVAAPTVTVGATGLGVPHDADVASGTTTTTTGGAFTIPI